VEHFIQVYSAFFASAVGLCLFAWVLLRGARSTPTRLMSLLVGSLAELQGFEFLWLCHRTEAYVHLEFAGVVLAPCFVFHYAMSLAGSSALRRWAVASAYAAGVVFIAVAVGGLWSPFFHKLFWEPKHYYNTTFMAVYSPFIVWALAELARGRVHAPDRGTRSLFAYPLAAGLVIMPAGFLELTSELGWNPPRFASLGCLAGSVIIAAGVVRNRSVYDALALLRKDAASVLRASEQGILYVEPGGSLLFTNRLARTLLGLEKDPRTLADAGLEVPAEGRAVIRRGDRVIEIRVVKSAEVVPAGRLSLILQDKTRDYELLQQLASQETLASLGQAAATLAHEIRNPLTTLKSSIDCATQDLDAGQSPERRHLELAGAEVQRLNELLERSLQLSRPLELHREACEVGSLLSRMVDRVPPQDGTRIVKEIEPGLPSIPADPDLLAQLFANLLRNAVEAAREIRVSAARAGERLAVRIFSAGARIPDEILPRLFEPFVTSKAKGTGLGLALCRKIAAAHGASVDGRNVDGGVLFEVSFPL
jgi:signal transduction histidine kinase